MGGFLDKMRHATGINLDHNELYARAFQKGVLLNKFGEAADIFDKAARKFVETGDQMMAAQAAANSLLYRYLSSSDPGILPQAIQALNQLQQIEKIRSQTEFMPVGPLCAELDCRIVEGAIALAQDDVIRSSDLHKLARDKFQQIIRNELYTYAYVPAKDGHNDKADMRYFYHSGMYSFYEAMAKKNRDPSAAADDLSLASQAFRRCNDQAWSQRVSTLLENWRISRTCWICHREMQGADLHFTMCRATVTPYTMRILEKLKQDPSTLNMDGRVAVCNTCGSMVTFKAMEEADKVRQELNGKIQALTTTVANLENRIGWLERKAHTH
ncbi:MAG TPA: hypothetical protein VKV40_02635 [Ktedonobacteraceae bacterium]|nr:hypothetical protein [Ktedonobacteraceae bacterium]